MKRAVSISLGSSTRDKQVTISVGGVDLSLRLDERKSPLRAALQLVQGVTKTPLCDGGSLKRTLERRVFKLVQSELGDLCFKQGFVLWPSTIAPSGQTPWRPC